MSNVINWGRAGSAVEKTPLAEFWKPGKTAAGETLVGRVERFGRNTVNGDETEFVVLTPAVIVSPTGNLGQGFATMAVGINADLRRSISPTDAASWTGKAVAIQFTGSRNTQKGEMREFSVYQLDDARYESALKTFAPELVNAQLGDGKATKGADDLPF